MNLPDQLKQSQDECRMLRKENEDLKRRLAVYEVAQTNTIVTNASAPLEKVRVFRDLFKGRTDLFAQRWVSKTGKSGYVPACSNEWKSGICNKPAIKCSDCQHRKLTQLSDQAIYDHLSGKHTVGLYPLLPNNTCWVLAVDFDKGEWVQDILAFVEVCKSINVYCSIERSRSGNGAHVWVFFNEEIPAILARQLGAALLAKTKSSRSEVDLNSYDRLFPNQDTLPKGGFGNLIALPLQRGPRENGNSLFIDETLTPYQDQWAYISTINKMSRDDVECAIQAINVKNRVEPKLIPSALTATLKNGIFISMNNLPSSLQLKLTELATFSNPEFYKLQAKRMSTHNINKMIDCTTINAQHLILPRGCEMGVKEIMETYKIKLKLKDNRFEGTQIEASFKGNLTIQQQDALQTLLQHDNGILSAATGFGKTVLGAALIAERKVNTLIIVHRTQLMVQWIDQLSTFLDIPKVSIGQIGGGKQTATGFIDVATIQSLNSKGQINAAITGYGQVIVDECHHLAAYSFEQVLKSIRAKYVHGLTATPIRKDGLQPIIEMQCGPIRYKTDLKAQAQIRPFYTDS